MIVYISDDSSAASELSSFSLAPVVRVTTKTTVTSDELDDEAPKKKRPKSKEHRGLDVYEDMEVEDMEVEGVKVKGVDVKGMEVEDIVVNQSSSSRQGGQGSTRGCGYGQDVVDVALHVELQVDKCAQNM